MKRHERIIPLPASVKQKWDGLQEAINVAAAPFTGDATFPISIMHLHDIPEAEAALDHAMSEVRRSVPEVPLHGGFVMTKVGPASEVAWWA